MTIRLGAGTPGGIAVKDLLTCVRAGLVALTCALLGAALLGGPATAHAAELPTPVTVTVEFVDNVCVGIEYTAPMMEAPHFPGTSQTVTGSVAPGETVEVAYTALEGFVIQGPSTFTHTFPTEPASATDCLMDDPPEPLVRERTTVRTACDGIERREWSVVTDYVWTGTEWVLGEPEIQDDTGWVFVRPLTESEQRQLGCRDTAGEKAAGPGQQVAPAVAAAPAQETLPRSVAAGLPATGSTTAPTPADQLWLAPSLGGVILLGLAAFTRLRAPAPKP